MVTAAATETRALSPRMNDMSPRRAKIYFQDDALRRRSELNVQQLLTSATSSESSNCSLLAKKALKYRKILDRMTGVDPTSPDFDVFKFLGVDWCKTQSLKAHCQRQQCV